MKIRLTSKQVAAMTRVDFIVVVVLLGVLAVLILPASPGLGRKRKAPIVFAQKDMADIKSAIEMFRHDYGYLPVAARTAALTNADFTFGTFQSRPNADILNGSASEANNSEVIRILSPELAPAGTPLELAPVNRNPRTTQYFNAKPAPDNRSRGIGQDGVFRDPWGNPYMLTLDLDGDGHCKDAFYRKAVVSRKKSAVGRIGLTGLTNSTSADGLSDDYVFPGPVMVWSFGQDGQASPTERADSGANRDNVLSWR